MDFSDYDIRFHHHVEHLMSRPPAYGIIADDRQLDLVEFLETSNPRPFHIWADRSTHLMEVMLDGDQPTQPRMQKLRVINTAIEAAASKLLD
jgi:hypothetical protein